MQTHEAIHAQDTSAKALNGIGWRNIQTLQDQLLDIVVAAQRNGSDDLSRKEIQARYELVYGKRIESSSVAARVKNLIDGHRLEQVATSRLCTVTGRDIHPVRVPMTQARLVG